MDAKTIIISIIAALLAFVICGFIYQRMIKREVPEPIGKLQAILPVVLGCICVPISAGSGIGLLAVLRIIGIEGAKMQALSASFFTAFFMVGGVEELFKFLAIIIPTALHTLYDAGTIFNYPVLKNGDFIVGGILGGVAILTNIVLLIYVLVRAKKNAEKFSALSVLPEDAQ